MIYLFQVSSPNNYLESQMPISLLEDINFCINLGNDVETPEKAASLFKKHASKKGLVIGWKKEEFLQVLRIAQIVRLRELMNDLRARIDKPPANNGFSAVDAYESTTQQIAVSGIPLSEFDTSKEELAALGRRAIDMEIRDKIAKAKRGIAEKTTSTNTAGLLYNLVFYPQYHKRQLSEYIDTQAFWKKAQLWVNKKLVPMVYPTRANGVSIHDGEQAITYVLVLERDGLITLDVDRAALEKAQKTYTKSIEARLRCEG